MMQEEPRPLSPDEILEITVAVDSEAAEAVSELFNRYNGGGYEEDSEAGEAGGGGAVIETTGLDDAGQPIDGAYRMVVKTYLKPGPRGQEIRRRIQEGLWRLSLIYPIPEPAFNVIRQEDWANAWRKFYQPMRIGQHVVLKPSWEDFDAGPEDLVVELEPGMAFGTGMHPTTRLCVAALEDVIRPGDLVLDVGTGSGVLAVVAVLLGARHVVATDIDPIAVDVAGENIARNGMELAPAGPIDVRQESVPDDLSGACRVLVANILAEVLVGLFDSLYETTPLAAPLAPGGIAILSGILDEKADMVVAAAARHGLSPLNRYQEGDWVALVFQKEPAA